jgi:hypothetical protein
MKDLGVDSSWPHTTDSDRFEIRVTLQILGKGS